MGETKETLKQIATDAVQRSGVQSMTIRDLGSAVGIKSSSVMYHFRSKKGLIREIAEDYVAAVFDELHDIQTRETRAGDRLLGLVGIFERMLEQDRMCLCGVLAADAQELDEQTQELVEGFFDRLERWVAGILQEQKGGDLGRNEARRQARVILASLEGALLLDKSEGTPKRLAAVRSWVAGSVGGSSPRTDPAPP